MEILRGGKIMILRNGSETVKFRESVKTGVHKTEHKYGTTSSTTYRTIEHTMIVSVYAEVNDAELNCMIQRACKNKSQRCTDGPVTVKVRKEKVVSMVELPCSVCGKKHDYGIPCAEVK